MVTVIGTMSGTSADGIDLAEIETDGRTVARFGAAAMFPYQQETRTAVLDAVARGAGDRTGWPQIAQLVTRDHAEALERYMAEQGLAPDLVVFHGQTVWHDPGRGETVQLGDPQGLADRLGVPVVGDVRLADMAAGGQGAPLVPVYHQALAWDLPQPLCFLNIGGVSNLTYVDGDTLLAFDIGPGNALIDDWVRAHGAGDFDADGAIAARGKADEEVLEKALTHPFFAAPGPKSLDRNAFASVKLREGTSLEDGAATLLAFTVGAIARAEALCPKPPVVWLVCGGGRRNGALMTALDEALSGRVEPVDLHGLDGDGLEAQAMAFLGARLLEGLPTSFPATTGATHPVVGGRLYRPAKPAEQGRLV